MLVLNSHSDHYVDDVVGADNVVRIEDLGEVHGFLAIQNFLFSFFAQCVSAKSLSRSDLGAVFYPASCDSPLLVVSRSSSSDIESGFWEHRFRLRLAFCLCWLHHQFRHAEAEGGGVGSAWESRKGVRIGCRNLSLKTLLKHAISGDEQGFRLGF
ncbi:hypothetical protein SESBI_02971 [Sesbania bispinosa]|nr:hypothetical protein SESBI_02971 [Sesbania bispinosa]